MAEWEGIYTIWFREAKRYVRYRSRIVSSVVTPLLWLLIFGTGLGSAIKIQWCSWRISSIYISRGLLVRPYSSQPYFLVYLLLWIGSMDFSKRSW